MASTSRGMRVRSSNKTVLLSEHLGMVTDGRHNIDNGRWDSNDEALLPLEENKFSGLSNQFTRYARMRKYLTKRKKRMMGNRNDSTDALERRDGLPSGCLKLYAKRGGCKVVSCEEVEADNGRSSVTEQCIPRDQLMRMEKNGLECFSQVLSEMMRKKSVLKEKEPEPPKPLKFSLPDHVLEMCLVRLPITALMTARLVCKKWRSLTTASRFMQLRSEGLHRSPCLFLFGISKDDGPTSEIYALDISMDEWHRFNADAIKEMSLFSVASVRTDLYVIGGCLKLNNFSSPRQRGSLKTQKGVFVFSPLTGSWRKAASMNSARASPIVGVFEDSSGCAVLEKHPEWQQDNRPQRSRVGGVSDVYQDPHGCSVRRQFMDSFCDNDESAAYKEKSLIGQERNSEKKYALIVVGGRGSWDECLNSGEIYDPVTNRWIGIAKLPVDFGTVCSGTVCNGVFYIYSDIDKLAGYNIGRDMWFSVQTYFPPPNLREYDPMVICCNNQLFLLSVTWSESDRMLNVGEKLVRKLWELNHTYGSWTEVSRHPDAPLDWNAVYVADNSRIYGVEMFKIFGQVVDFLTVCDVSHNERATWNRLARQHIAHGAKESSLLDKKLAILNL